VSTGLVNLRASIDRSKDRGGEVGSDLRSVASTSGNVVGEHLGASSRLTAACSLRQKEVIPPRAHETAKRPIDLER
jgi:hypothetical protein